MIRLNERQGLASMPSRRRSAWVSARSTRSKGKRELLPQLVAGPLQAQRGRREDQHTLDPSAQEELAQDQPRFNGLAEANIVGNEAGSPAASRSAFSNGTSWKSSICTAPWNGLDMGNRSRGPWSSGSRKGEAAVQRDRAE